MTTKDDSGIVTAMFWIFILSILLFWLPVFGPLFAGISGGRKAGSLGNTILAVILTVIVISGVLFTWTSATNGLSIVQIMTGLNGLPLILLTICPLIMGAIIGYILNK